MTPQSACCCLGLRLLSWRQVAFIFLARYSPVAVCIQSFKISQAGRGPSIPLRCVGGYRTWGAAAARGAAPVPGRCPLARSCRRGRLVGELLQTRFTQTEAAIPVEFELQRSVDDCS